MKALDRCQERTAPLMRNKWCLITLDFFAGIGGLSSALQLAKIPVNRLIVIEQDHECRRLNADLVVDIRKVAKRDVEKWLRSVPG